MRRYTRTNNEPRQIKARFDSHCKETGALIRKNDTCIYYPSGKAVYCMDSKQAREYFDMKQDDQLTGSNYDSFGCYRTDYFN